MRSNFFAAVIAVLGAANAASAAPIDPINVRQAVIRQSTVPEPTLQQILTGGTQPVFADSSLDVTSDQSVYGLFSGIGNGNNLGTIELLPTLVSANHSTAKAESFGIWFGNDSASLLRVDLLLSAATVGDSAALSVSDGALQVGAGTGTCGVSIACQTINDVRISSSGFGFYFAVNQPGVPIGYTVDALNPQGPARVLAFDGGASKWAFGYEDRADFDYQDMVVAVGAISAVPEPGALALAMLGGMILLGSGRRGPNQR